MSDHAVAVVDMNRNNDSTQANPLFRMDLFGIHLASRLVGRDTLLNLFQKSDSVQQHAPVDSKPTCLGYWKTPLLTSTTTTTTTATTTISDDDWNVVFVDVTVEWHVSTSKVTSTIGMMLQRNNQKQVVYVTAEPLCFSQLKSHCDAIGIDIESTSPDAIAHSLGGALMTLSSQTVNVRDDDTPTNVLFANQTRLPLRLDYNDLQETGILEFKTLQVDSFHGKSFAMMLQNLQRLDTLEAANANSNVVEQVRMAAHDAQAAAVLTKSFDTWLKAWTQGSEASKAVSTVESMKNPAASSIDPGGKENVAATFKTDEATSRTDQSTDTTTTTTVAPVETKSAVPESKKEEEEPKKSQPAVKRPQAGYVRVSNPKRKRRGKLTFAKQES